MKKLTSNEEFIDEFSGIIDKKIKEIADWLIEEHPEDYYIGEESYGYYNNGIGMASYGSEKVYDEDRAYEDAKELLACDTCGGAGTDYELLFREDVESAIAKFIRSR